MGSNKERKSKPGEVRSDLASRLLRPHLFFIRDAHAPASVGESTAESPARIRRGASDEPAFDVICCGMYRACSTWQYEVIAHLAEEYLGGRRLGYLTAAQYRDLEREDARTVGQKGRAPRVFKSHEGDRVFATTLAEGRARAVYAYRDVRDVVFSLAHKRNLTFRQLLRQGMIHQVLANDRFWTRGPHVLVQRYEDLLRAPAEGVLDLARHIGLYLDYSEAERIAEIYSRESNRARTAALRHQLHQAGIDLAKADNAQICDPTTLLHWNHMRDPNCCWRSEATAEDAAILHRLCGRWLFDRGYEGVSRRISLSTSGQTRPRISMQARVDLMAGSLNFVIRSMSLRFPSAALSIKRLLGMPAEDSRGATVWAGGRNTKSGRARTSAAIEARVPGDGGA